MPNQQKREESFSPNSRVVRKVLARKSTQETPGTMRTRSSSDNSSDRVYSCGALQAECSSVFVVARRMLCSADWLQLRNQVLPVFTISSLSLLCCITAIGTAYAQKESPHPTSFSCSQQHRSAHAVAFIASVVTATLTAAFAAAAFAVARDRRGCDRPRHSLFKHLLVVTAVSQQLVRLYAPTRGEVTSTSSHCQQHDTHDVVPQLCTGSATHSFVDVSLTRTIPMSYLSSAYDVEWKTRPHGTYHRKYAGSTFHRTSRRLKPRRYAMYC